jgi:NDP-4-keto-2,6-dideoxyhexose 3-C-methyltransferase
MLRCRVCDNPNLRLILRLGDIAMVNFDNLLFEAPLNLIWCDNCDVMQLADTVSPDRMFRKYWYRSGINQSMRTQLFDIVEKGLNLAKPKAGDTVIDIGANDGTLLRAYSAQLNRIGFEPSDLAQIGKDFGLNIIQDYFHWNSFYDVPVPPKAKIITAIAMFYDLDDPHKFIVDIEGALHPDGVFIIQVNYLPTMLKNNQYDGICHEHLLYYSLHSLIYLFEVRNNLKIFDIEFNDTNGGSIRLYIKHKASKQYTPKIDKIFGVLVKEDHTLEKQIKQFGPRVRELINNTHIEIESLFSQQKTIYGIGASTKSFTIIEACGIRQWIHAIVDRNPDKVGRKMLGIPIISEDDFLSRGVDYAIVFPYFFFEEMKARYNFKGKYIIPVPKFKIV